MVRKATRRGEAREWIKTRARNEGLDLEVGCYAMAVYAGIKRMDAAAWARLRALLTPPQRDLFAPATAPATAGAASSEPAETPSSPPARPAVQTSAQRPPAPRVPRPPVARPGGFVNAWRPF
jgi:phage terminase large subunit GpA-like protein